MHQLGVQAKTQHADDGQNHPDQNEDEKQIAGRGMARGLKAGGPAEASS
jgi:hypothetical protein